MTDKHVDIFVIGGGINGCGIARDAVGRSYSVMLAERDDLASGTSSLSTKLIHGGLRYLEYYEFRLVRESLVERELLWSLAPHLIRPLRFVLPFEGGPRPAWMLRVGLFIYDHLGGRKRLPPTKTLDLRADAAGRSLRRDFAKAFEYSDCSVDDARLVVANAIDAADRGAVIRTRSPVVAAKGASGRWSVTIEDEDTGARETVSAKLLVNAAGPWVDQVLDRPLGRSGIHNVRLVQGSHIVVPRIYDHDRAYIFQNPDNRVIFAIPFAEDFTLIGTTDRDYSGDPAEVRITEEEIDYLCDAAREYFRKDITRADIVWTFSGLRPLYDDGASKAQEATRDYVLKTDRIADGAPVITLFGGKITTYRCLAETVIDEIGAAIGRKGGPWTARTPLPGGDFAIDDLETRIAALRHDYPFLSAAEADRLFAAYGTAARDLLGDAGSAADLGLSFGAGLSAREVEWMIENEWARTADDILWRRSKLGLKLSDSEAAALAAWLAGRQSSAGTSDLAGSS